LVITYGTDPSDELTYDKVIAREEGGVNASGVAAGGRSTISYSLMNQDVPPGDKTVPRKRATIVDPRGNVRTSYVNEDDQHILDRIYTRGVREGEPEYFETRHDFNRDHQIVRTVLPSGDEVHYTYGSGSRAAERNVIAVRRVAAARGDGRGGPAEDLVTTFTYEPLFNRVLTVTDPRGNSATYTPPLGTNDPGRYTRRFFYDYMEHTDPVPLAVALGIDLSSVPRGLGDLNGDGRTDQSFGNVVRTEAPAVLLAPDSLEAARLGSTTQVIVTETRWNDRGQPIATVDAEGNVTLMAYHSEDDPDGDGLRTASAWRVLSAARTGYLRAITVDALDGAHAPRRTASAPAAALETTLRYDRVGNVVAVRNPRGVETHMEVTALNQVVVTTRGADVSQAVASGQLLGQEAPLRYKSRAFYDHDGRVVRTEVENRDSTTAGVGAWIERTLVYDILGGLLSSTVEVDPTTHLTTTFRYDPNQNLVEVTAPEGTRLVTTYDERDLVHTVTRGPGTTDASTATVDYDLNGNRVRLTQAEHTPAQPKQTHFVFDGFDRLVEAIDALGGRALTHYDVASQVVRVQAFGHPAGAPGAAPVLMSDVRFSHDELGRVFRTDAALFVPGGQSFLRTPALSDHDGDGFVTARVDYDALSRATHVVEDDLQVTRTIYDGASRVIEVRDALGNRRLVQHDRNGNAVAATSVEVSAEGLVPPQGFTTRYVYDQLDRLIRATDNAGQTSRFGYDSRDNLVFRSDPEGALTADPLGVFPGTINAHGNTVTYHFDGLDRMIRQVIDLRVGGTGAGGLDLSNPRNPDGQVSLGYVFDGNSRLSAIVDDNGNRTTFGYDALNRRERQTNADGKSYLFQFDRDDNVRQVTDPNGSVITKTYDALNRLVELTVARGSGVVGTTRETYSYDGLSRLVRSTDDNGHAATALQVAEAAFDSLGRVLEERQNGRAVSSQYTGDGKRTQVMYPGGRTITRAFDAIDRIKQLKDGPTVLAHTDWIGPGLRELRRINANGTRLTFLNDAGNQDIGYDQVQRIVRLRVTGAGGAAIVDRIYGYNRASQRTLERRNDDFGLTDRYTYDSAYRVVASSYDQDGLPGAVKRELNAVSYRYDGVGNRRDVTKDVVGVGVLAEAYTVNAVNEYVSVAGVTRRHDDNGNLTDDGRRLLHYDYKNRLVAVSDRQTGAPVAAYEYLADGRRAKKKLFGAAGQVVKATAFFCDGAQEVEEQDATSGATEATYVWSPVYVDELVTYTNASGTFFTHQDARCNVVAITDAAGNVVERVRFDDFGRAEVRGPGGEVRAGSAVGCAYGFQGRRLDAETGLLYFRARYYDPETGRFLQRDPVWDAGNVGGQYTFCGNGPLSRRDPDGNSWLMDAFWDWAKCRVFFNAFGGNMSYDPNDIDQLWNDHLMRVEAANLVGGIADTAFDSGLAEFMSGMIPGIGLGGAGARGLASAAAGAGRSAGGLGRGTSAAAGAGRSAGAGARSSSGGAGAGARGTTSAGGGTSGGGVARGGAGGAGKSSQPPQAVPVNPRMGQESGSNITRWSDGSPRDLSRFQMTHQAEQRLADQAARSGKYQVIRPEAGAGAGDLGFIPKSGGPVRFAEVHAPTGAKAARGATKPAGQVTDTGMQNVLKSIDAQGRMPGVSQRGASKISETSVLKISEALGL
ncbi:MAG: RHS repeat-associated core domain-containing protein, partial [Planctomycetota bacterium]|nr:RHS repeat-associated core domain-containing protein [Planctomycetota bacterium]